MKSILTSIAAGALLATLATAQPRRYDIVDLGQVGGAPGQPFTIAKNGLIAGSAAAANGSQHATLWYRNWKADFSKPGLGGANSVAFGVNNRGQAAGEAETSASDPNKEDFCGFKALGLPATGNTCLPFVWQYGAMTPLPTLGGPNGIANQINNRGEIAGVAESTAFDKNCPAPQMLEFKPVVWQNGKIQELPTPSGDPVGVAFAVNDNGQVVGGSGACAPFSPNLLVSFQSLHALLWDKGNVIDIGNLGGTGHGAGIVAQNTNNLGQVVGASDLPGDMAFHAFLWSNQKGIQDLGTLAAVNAGDPPDVASAANGINDNSEVTGLSLDAKFSSRAFHWQNGMMSDLNTLVRENPAGLYLALACSINSRGEIIGLGFDGSGNAHGYLAVPRLPDDDGETASQAVHILPEEPRIFSGRRFFIGLQGGH